MTSPTNHLPGPPLHNTANPQHNSISIDQASQSHRAGFPLSVHSNYPRITDLPVVGLESVDLAPFHLA